MDPVASETSPYATDTPSAQQTLDLFKGKWASTMPDSLGAVSGGGAGLFGDPRVGWAIAKLADHGIAIRDADVLELGPLEGAHAYLLEQAGAPTITAVEANPEAFLKCLVVKELLGLKRVNLLYGDACAFLKQSTRTYDLVFACGFLYHMTNPVELLHLISQRARSVFIWTVYWDAEFSQRFPEKAAGTDGQSAFTYEGATYTMHRHNYGTGFTYGKFWGGPAPYSNWMEKDDILNALRRFGFTNQTVELESNPNGCALRVLATKG